ncbi:MAG TPA: hypothetical protein VMZ92_13335 [Planctomycetota bacterium]|nr:hypothetical protein [Planctomycetota bacterium]
MIRTAGFVALVLLVLAIGARAQGAPPDLDKLKAEHALLTKTMESAQLKVQLHQTQLQLVQVLLQQATTEVESAQRAQAEFEARVRELLGATDGDEVNYETMTLVRKEQKE